MSLQNFSKTTSKTSVRSSFLTNTELCTMDIFQGILENFQNSSFYPVGTGRKYNVHKTFRRRPGRLLNALFMFNLRPVSTG